MATTATDRSFSSMLNDFLPTGVLRERVINKSFFLQNVEKDDSWTGASATSGEGAYIVPFQGAGASSVLFGNLPASTDIAEDIFVRGRITTQPELHGALIFQERDIMEHGKVSANNLLKILPDSVDAFATYLKQVISVSLLKGSYIAKVTVTGGSGSITVDRPDLFTIGQKISVDDDDSASTESASTTAYVTAINMNTKVLTVMSARTGGSAVDLTAYSPAQNAKIYHPQSQTNGFTSLRDALLSQANGGSANLYGVPKVNYPYTQAINVDGSGFSAASFISDLFDAFVTISQLGKGNITEVLMSYRNWGYVLKALEGGKGSYNIIPNAKQVQTYGWNSISVGGPRGSLKITGVNEMDNDVLYFVDWDALVFASNGLVRRRTGPNGNDIFEVRNASGFQYIIDFSCFGDLVVKKPSQMGIVYGIQ